MRLRPTIALVVFLAVAVTLSPSLRVAVLGQDHAHGSHPGAKISRTRGRNRIPSTPRLAIAEVNGQVGSGKPGLALRRLLGSDLRTRPARPYLHVSIPSSRTTPTSHLRC